MAKKYSVTVAAEESGWAAAPTGGTAEVTRAGIPGGCRGKATPARSAKALLMDGTAVESAFALLLEKVTKLVPYPAKGMHSRHLLPGREKRRKI